MAINAANVIKMGFERYIKTEKARIVISEVEQLRLWTQW